MKRKTNFHTNGIQRVFYPKRIHDTVLVNGIHIDKKIYPLIKVLWEEKIITIESCQGGDLCPFQNKNESTYQIGDYYINKSYIIIDKKYFLKTQEYMPDDISIREISYNRNLIWIFFNNKYLKTFIIKHSKSL